MANPMDTKKHGADHIMVMAGCRERIDELDRKMAPVYDLASIEPKLCKDCNFCNATGSHTSDWTCDCSFIEGYINLQDGSSRQPGGELCIEVRRPPQENELGCGPEGKYFKPKAKEPAPPVKSCGTCDHNRDCWGLERNAPICPPTDLSNWKPKISENRP